MPFPADLACSDVSGQVTSYSVLASEHATYLDSQKDKAKNESKRNDSDSDDSEPPFGRTVTRKSVKAKKVMDALFHVRWWRIVLGVF
jgi:hypothetical protein